MIIDNRSRAIYKGSSHSAMGLMNTHQPSYIVTQAALNSLKYKPPVDQSKLDIDSLRN